jgi:hypothetical protein
VRGSAEDCAPACRRLAGLVEHSAPACRRLVGLVEHSAPVSAIDPEQEARCSAYWRERFEKQEPLAFRCYCAGAVLGFLVGWFL